MMKMTDEERERHCFQTVVLYVDDLNLMTESEAKTDDGKTECLKINVAQTKVMTGGEGLGTIEEFGSHLSGVYGINGVGDIDLISSDLKKTRLKWFDSVDKDWVRKCMQVYMEVEGARPRRRPRQTKDEQDVKWCV